MTDEEVIRKLAERDGFTEVYDWKPGFGTYKDRGCNARIPSYLTSRDALAPILAGLSEEEWQRMSDWMWHHFEFVWIDAEKVVRGINQSIERMILTLPPRDLAYAIAEVL